METDLTRDQSLKASGTFAERIDSQWLGKWIQPQHLTPDALVRYHDAYHAGKIPYLRISQFLPSAVSDRLYQLLSTEGHLWAV